MFCVLLIAYPSIARSEQEGRILVQQHRLACPHPMASTLALRGAYHYKYMRVLSLFKAALYDQVENREKSILDAVPKCLVLRYERNISASDFRDVTIKGVNANLNGAQIARIKPALDAYNKLYVDIHPGDSYALAYAPSTGVELFFNGTLLGHVNDESFIPALFAIWLGPEKNMSNKLRDHLLGKGKRR